MKCHLVHGYNIKDGGNKTIDRLLPYLNYSEITTVEHDYGHLNIYGVLTKNKKIASKIVRKLGSDDVAIGHSNGCAILVKSLQQGAVLDKLILINPALDKHFEFPESVNEIHIFHSHKDKVVVLAKYLRKLVFWRNTFLWGEMGNTGYRGNDSRVTNHLMKTKHSGIFKDIWIEEFSVIITDIIKSK